MKLHTVTDLTSPSALRDSVTRVHNSRSNKYFFIVEAFQEERDISEVSYLWSRCSRETLRKRFHNSQATEFPRHMIDYIIPQIGKGKAWLIYQDGSTVGVSTCVYGATAEEPTEFSILLVDEVQKQGIGSALAERTKNFYTRPKTVVTEMGNMGATKLGRKMGL